MPAFCAKSGAFDPNIIIEKRVEEREHDKESISDHGCTERIHHRSTGQQGVRGSGKKIVAAAERGEYYKVIITKDTHTVDYLDTQEGKRLPVLHGQEGTEGYKIHPDIVKAVQEHYAPENVITVKKPTFGSPEFGKLLKTIWEEVTAAGEAAEGEYPMEVDFTGFCTGICVLSNVVMAKAFVPEARVCVIENACACVTPQTHQTAIAAMGPIQVDVI